MSKTRYIDAKIFDFTADGHIIIDGAQGEHLIVKLGYAQVQNLDRCIQRYISYYQDKQEPAT